MANKRLSIEDWIDAARKALIRHGIDNVKVDKLARQLKVTRGSFYWHFANRAELLDALLIDWAITNTRPFEAVLQGFDSDGIREYEHIMNIWLEEEAYDPAYDSAIRDWARMSKHVANLVRRVDNRRIEIIKQVFIHIGRKEDEAFIRARITYFHQVGYYILGLNESKEERRNLIPLYTRVLLGKPF